MFASNAGDRGDLTTEVPGRNVSSRSRYERCVFVISSMTLPRRLAHSRGTGSEGSSIAIRDNAVF